MRAEKSLKLGKESHKKQAQTQQIIPAHVGHRARLRKRFLKAGADGLADYELLELLLFGALPRGDTKPLAKRLIHKFGSLKNVLTASCIELKEVPGVALW